MAHHRLPGWLLVVGLSALAPAGSGCTPLLPVLEADAGSRRDAPAAPDAPALDAPTPDAPPLDAGEPDDAPAPVDGGPPDAGPPDAGPPPCVRGTPFGAPSAVTSLSVAMFDDDGLTVSRDELEAIVRSGIEDTFWLHSRSDVAAPFGTASATGVNLVNTDQGPFLSASGLELFFASARVTAPSSEVLFRSARASRMAAFGAPARVTVSGGPGPGGGPNDLNDPYLVGDTLYFSAVGPSAARGLFTATRTAPDTFGSVTLISELDSNGNDDFSPVVSEDGLEIFFARDGAGSGDDIVSATRASTGDRWGPVTIATALRSGQNDQPEALSADGCRLYFVSNRGGGRWDVYVASRAP